jgi:hypothetical protein
MPLFTIGIPTFNRAGFLRRAIEAGLDQSYPEVEVVVLDDASTDETPEVVRSFGDRVRYHRNPRNIGSWPNFAAVAELARGEFFSWLQDDDLIHRDFASRAVRTMVGDDKVVVYTAFELDTPSATVCDRRVLYGPPIALEWMRGDLRIVDGSLVGPLSFFVSFANMPAIVFRTHVVRDAVRYFDPHCELFNERIVLSRAAARGMVAADPWPGAIFSAHEQQISKLLTASGDVTINQWLRSTVHLGALLEELGAARWRPLLAQCLEQVPVQDRVRWFCQISPGFALPERFRAQAHPSAREVRSVLLESLPDSARREVSLLAMQSASHPSLLKQAARQLLPPLVWNGLRSARRALLELSHG